MSGPVALLRDLAARRDAIDTYHRHYEHFAETAQVYAGTNLGRTVAATATMFLVAADAEATDPVPREAPSAPCCAMCILYRTLPAKGPHVLS